MNDFDPTTLPRGAFESRIAALEGRQAEQEAALKKTAAELSWWREGLALFAAEPQSDETPVEAAIPKEVARTNGSRPTSGPDPSTTASNPTVRQAIVRVMIEDERKEWAAGDIIAALRERDWMPGGEYAENTARTKLRALVKQGAVKKVRYGHYALHPSVRNGEMKLEV
jgi:hypothetical protein